ncbi:MAG: collagen-like protein, partial [Wolbachia endosymbiont of Homalodisca vitripennis]|nr:collagen-like protein [Wolbachia endosymbiont of Homalodisca vitripennis]MCJ7476102.1 collagen-like protein [Wolbachia endosymbiont of Homalodisca vitripennis]
MRFKLERKDILKNNCSNLTNYVLTTKVRVRDEIFSLPTISYVTFDERTDQRFIIIDNNRKTQTTLEDLSKGLQLKLEKVGNDYKLALVTDLGNHYYYQHSRTQGGTVFNTILPLNNEDSSGYRSYQFNLTSCSVGFAKAENMKVLIDPKDLITNENIDHILHNLKNSPDKRLEIQTGDLLFKESDYVYKYYRSVNVYDFTGSKVGMLNNVIPIFDRRDNNFKLFPFHEMESLKAQDTYFAVKKLGNNYVGCISYENSTCKNFYNFNPNSFGYEHGNRPGPYPYYYNLENFDNFLEVDVNIQEHINLETEIELLKRRIERLEHTGVQGPKGEPGERGQKGDRGFDGAPGPYSAPICLDHFFQSNPIFKMNILINTS